MKYTVLFLLLFTCFAATAQYHFDKNDFFEIQGSYATFAQNKTLVVSSIEEGDLEVKNLGLKGYGFGIKYGKAITTFAHLTFGVSYSKRERAYDELVERFEQGEYIYTYKIRSLSSALFEFGPRIKFLNTDRFELSAGGGGFAKLTPSAPLSFSGGYYYHGILGFNFNQRTQLNVKFGFESTIGTTKYSSLPLEMAFHHKIY